jgi:hypothetical protein
MAIIPQTSLADRHQLTQAWWMTGADVETAGFPSKWLCSSFWRLLLLNYPFRQDTSRYCFDAVLPKIAAPFPNCHTSPSILPRCRVQSLQNICEVVNISLHSQSGHQHIGCIYFRSSCKAPTLQPPKLLNLYHIRQQGCEYRAIFAMAMMKHKTVTL